MQDKQLQNQIEAILFYKSEPITLKDLSRLLDTDEKTVDQAIRGLEQSLKNRGLTLVVSGDEYSLTTAPSVSAMIEKLVKDELNRDLSQASLEVLSIVAYRGLVSRKEIEYIRGVNSSFSLRALVMRGLIDREVSRLDERIFLYKPTHDLLLHLGISSINELPEWQAIQDEIKKMNMSGEAQSEK